MIVTGSGLSHGIVNIHFVVARENITFLIAGLRSYLKFAVSSQGMSSYYQLTQMTKTCRIFTQTFLLILLKIWTILTTHKKIAASHSRDGVTYWDNGSNDGERPGSSQLWLKWGCTLKTLAWCFWELVENFNGGSHRDPSTSETSFQRGLRNPRFSFPLFFPDTSF